MNQGHVRPADQLAAAAIICLAILPTARSSCIWILQQRDLEAAGHGARIDVLDAFCQGIESRFSNESRGVFVKLEPCHQVGFHRSGIDAHHDGFLVTQLKAERLGGRMQGRFRGGIGRREGKVLHAEHRNDVDNAAPAVVGQGFGEGPGDVQRAEVVDLHFPPGDSEVVIGQRRRE